MCTIIPTPPRVWWHARARLGKPADVKERPLRVPTALEWNPTPYIYKKYVYYSHKITREKVKNVVSVTLKNHVTLQPIIPLIRKRDLDEWVTAISFAKYHGKNIYIRLIRLWTIKYYKLGKRLKNQASTYKMWLDQTQIGRILCAWIMHISPFHWLDYNFSLSEYDRDYS